MSEGIGEELKAQIRKTPLVERLRQAVGMIASMCMEVRPPRMSIPVQAWDEDFFISVLLLALRFTVACESLAALIFAISRLQGNYNCVIVYVKYYFITLLYFSSEGKTTDEGQPASLCYLLS
jgi:hypothetical protein